MARVIFIGQIFLSNYHVNVKEISFFKNKICYIIKGKSYSIMTDEIVDKVGLRYFQHRSKHSKFGRLGYAKFQFIKKSNSSATFRLFFLDGIVI